MKIVFFLTLCFLVEVNNHANSQNLLWAKQMGGLNSDGGSSIFVDINGNVYSTGSFQDTVDFDPGIGTYNLIATDSADIYVSKLDAFGNFVWAKKMGGVNNEAGHSVFVDTNGNVYVTGWFSGTADFDPDTSSYYMTSSAGMDIFICKMNNSGNFLWAKRIGGNQNQYSMSIAIDPKGNVCTTGFFQNLVDFNLGSGVYNLNSGGYDIFVSKLDSSGNFIMAKQMGGNPADEGISIAVNGNGNIYTSGYFQYNADFDPGTGTYTLSSSGSTDIFISKLDSLGNFIWAKKMGGASTDWGYSIAVDLNGNLYTTGWFSGTADFDPDTTTYNLTSNGGYDIFVSKLDSSGNFLWAKQFGGIGNDAGISIGIDGSGNVYTTGYFSNAADFDPGNGIYNLISAGNIDIFISKLNSSGNFVWAEQLGGTSDDAGTSISVDASENVYVTGYFSDTVDFDSGVGIFNLNSFGSHDIFVVKLGDATGIAENYHSLNSVNIYPNPSHGKIKITSSNNIDVLEIRNTMGQIIYQIKPNAKDILLQLTNDGIYFVTLISNEQTTTRKLIVCK